MPRSYIRDFSLYNPAYINATVAFYTVEDGERTETLAALYAGSTGSAQVENPQRLGSRGILQNPVYHEDPIIAVVTSDGQPSHSTGIIKNVEADADRAQAAADAIEVAYASFEEIEELRDETVAAAAQLPANKFDATVNPTVNDDSSAGYSPGSRWQNISSEEVFACIDASEGAAVWVTTTLTIDELGTAATQDVGTATGNVVQIVNLGGVPSVPASLVPANYSIFQKVDIFTPAFKKTAAQTISIKAGTRIAIGGQVFYWASDTAVTMPTHSAGTDYSIWLKTDGSLEAVADSFGSPATTGDISAPQSGAVKVGGYHYGLVGPTETVAGGGFSTSGVTSAGGSFGWVQADVDKIKGINEFSIWDDTFKCAGEQRGLSFIPWSDDYRHSGFWWGNYFMSDNPDANGASAYNTNIASGTVLPYIPSTWGGDGSTKYSRLAVFEALEMVSSFGLRLPFYAELMRAAFGVTEGQSLGGASSTVPLTKREPGYTSRYGIEQATGHQYAIGGPIHSVGGSSWSGVGRGSIYAGAGEIILGGYRNLGSDSGSRCANFGDALSLSNWHISVRAAGDHLNLGQAAR